MSKKNKQRKENQEISPEELAAASPSVGSGEEAAAPPEEEVPEVDRLRAEVAEWKDKFLRAKAEQQNAARRATNELEESVRYANTNLLRALVDVVDDFDRSVEAAGNCETVEAVLDGLRIVHDKLVDLLRANHVETIDAEGKAFDPARHEALMQQPSDEHEPGTVMQQVQKGYLLRDRVLRPAKVIVAAAPAEEVPVQPGSKDQRD